MSANLGATNGTYHNVTLGQAGPLAGSSETAGSLPNGTSSYVSLPNNLLTDDTDVSVGLWFKAASGAHGVLFGYASGTISSGTPGAHVPALYIGTNGDLYGEFWTGTASPIATASAVTDGKWRYAVLTASSSSQTLYLDGAKVNTLSGQINQLNMAQDTVGAGTGAPGSTQARRPPRPSATSMVTSGRSRSTSSRCPRQRSRPSMPWRKPRRRN